VNILTEETINNQTKRVQLQSTNAQYNTQSALDIRLKTDELLLILEQNLRGVKQAFKMIEGKIVEETVTTNHRLMNDQGVDHVMTYMRVMINPHVFQSNIDEKMHAQLMMHMHSEIVDLIHMNRYIWDISHENMKLVTNLLIHPIGIVLTRPVDNLERDSYMVHVAHQDVGQNTQMQTNRKFGLGKVFQS